MGLCIFAAFVGFCGFLFVLVPSMWKTRYKDDKVELFLILFMAITSILGMLWVAYGVSLLFGGSFQ